MTSLHFKKSPRGHKGETPTHWTCASMRHCTSMSGGAVGTTPDEAVRLSLVETYTDRDDGSELSYIDTDIAKGDGVGKEVFGVVLVDGEYFWTGRVMRASARVAVSLDERADASPSTTLEKMKALMEQMLATIDSDCGPGARAHRRDYDALLPSIEAALQQEQNDMDAAR